MASNGTAVTPLEAMLSQTWRAEFSLPFYSTGPSVLQGRKRERPATIGGRFRGGPNPGSAPVQRRRPPSAPDLRTTELRPAPQDSPEPAQDPSDDLSDEENPQISGRTSSASPQVGDEAGGGRSTPGLSSRREALPESRCESRLSRVSSAKSREAPQQEVLQSPQAVTDPLLYKCRLDSSMKMFRLKTWRPYTLVTQDQPRHTCRNRPHSSKPHREAVMVLDTNASNDATENNNRCWTRRQMRPRSVPPHLLNGPPEPKKETDEMISRLAVEASSPILSTRVLSIMTPSLKVSVHADTSPESPTEAVKSSCDKGSSRPSDRTETQNHDSRSANAETRKEETTTSESSETESETDDDENDDDDENEEEEDTDTDGRSTTRHHTPKLNLRPDACETDFGPLEALPDPVCFDFDASTSTPPTFDYPYALPAVFDGTDFRRLVEAGHSWRQLEGITERHYNDAARAVLDRICDFERLQMATELQESNRRDQLRRAYRDQQDQVRRLRAQGVTPARIASATGRQPPTRQCCSTCLQPACVGDCPSKSARPKICVLCRQPYCEGTCAATSYEEHQRDVDAQGDRSQAGGASERRLRPGGGGGRPTSCGTCRSPVLASSQRLLNANSVVLGRPDSHRATFVVGRGAKRPPDLRPTAPDAHLRDNRAPYRHLSTMISKFEALGMSPTAPPHRQQRRRPRPRGRNAVEPGKSRQSCRRNSLTNGSTEGNGPP